ncbi:hypothetical protein HDU98_003360 [Podochytrium sp. JEL0797]|nr:hypothetical protein HDU98_003360 [Podochytrium sp. JEL0797]
MLTRHFALALGVSAIVAIVVLITPKAASGTSLDGCYDSQGNAVSLFASSRQPVNQSSVQCRALIDLATTFGFSNTSIICTQTTTITTPFAPTSFITARFCDPNTLAVLTVSDPPTSQSQIPPALALLSNLQSLTLTNAMFGAQILAPLLGLLQTPKYFQNLNLTGSPILAATPNRLLTGPLPPIPTLLQSSPFFTTLLLASNNFSGPLPPSYADSFTTLSLSSNPLLSGPLPPSLSAPLPDWSATQRCAFTNTSLCVPVPWHHQPACVRSSGLPTCDGSAAKPINPVDPLLASAITDGGRGGPATTMPTTPDATVYSIFGGLFGAGLLVMIVLGLCLHFRRWKRIRYGGGAAVGVEAGGMAECDLELRRMEELPAYMAPTPDYEYLGEDDARGEEEGMAVGGLVDVVRGSGEELSADMVHEPREEGSGVVDMARGDGDETSVVAHESMAHVHVVEIVGGIAFNKQIAELDEVKDSTKNENQSMAVVSVVGDARGGVEESSTDVVHDPIAEVDAVANTGNIVVVHEAIAEVGAVEEPSSVVVHEKP